MTLTATVAADTNLSDATVQQLLDNHDLFIVRINADSPSVGRPNGGAYAFSRSDLQALKAQVDACLDCSPGEPKRSTSLLPPHAYEPCTNGVCGYRGQMGSTRRLMTCYAVESDPVHHG